MAAAGRPEDGARDRETASRRAGRFPPASRRRCSLAIRFIEYPSAISVGPRPGAIFVAIDTMTGLGLDHVRRDEIRLVEDTKRIGYADKATVFASGFNSIQGLAWHDGVLYVMHAPFLTALRDTKGTGVADDRRDLLTGLGLTPEQNKLLLHCANGVVAGHDGWLYLALGDQGVDVPRPEGDRLVLQGGGILRCRPDGRDLHVFARGLRNIYDVALDAELNVFVRDNENDGGTYMNRLCHSIHGADHGYPYLYEEHPDEALAPRADLGLGSSARGVCYLETQFPPAFRGNLFFCEWGRAVMRYAPERAGSGFAPVQEHEFAAGDPKDIYPFKPTDIVVDSDGSLMIADWADGQRPKRGRGRIYRVTHVDPLAKATETNWPTPVDAESYSARCEAQRALERAGAAGSRALRQDLENKRLGPRGRMHAIWALARIEGPVAIDDLVRMVRADADPGVRAQAVRAMADLADPVLTEHKLNAGRGDADLSARLAETWPGQDPRVQLEIAIALGRLRWADAPEWFRRSLKDPDETLAHAVMQTLRRCDNWPAVVKLLDEPQGAPLRRIALRACADRP